MCSKNFCVQAKGGALPSAPPLNTPLVDPADRFRDNHCYSVRDCFTFTSLSVSIWKLISSLIIHEYQRVTDWWTDWCIWYLFTSKNNKWQTQMLKKNKKKNNTKNESYTEVNNYKKWNKHRGRKEFLQLSIMLYQHSRCVVLLTPDKK